MRIRRIIDSIPENGYIASNYVQALLHAAGTPLVDEFVSDNKEELVAFVRRCRFLIHSLRAYIIIQGTRGQKRVKEDKFAETIVRLSALLRFATEIKEMDINPFLAAQRAVLTNGGPSNATTTVVFQLYKAGFVNGQVGYSSAIAVTFFMLVMVISILQNKFAKED